jgi:hypothetical protein
MRRSRHRDPTDLGSAKKRRHALFLESRPYRALLVLAGLALLSDAATASPVYTTMKIRVVSVDPSITEVAIDDRFLLSFAIEDSTADTNSSFGGGRFPGLLTNVTMLPLSGNSGSWTPIGSFDLAASNYVTNALGDNLSFQLVGTGFPAGGAGLAFHDVDLSLDWPTDLTDSGLGDSFADQLLPASFGIPPASLFAGSGIRFTDGLDFPTATIVQEPPPAPIVFEGTIDSVPDPSGQLSPAIQVGVPFSVSYTLDVEEAGVGLEFGVGTNYLMPPGTPQVSVSVAGEDFTSASTGFIIGNGRDVSGFGPEFGVGDLWLPLLVNSGGIAVGVLFFDANGVALQDEAPFINTTLDGWTIAQMRIIDQGTEEVLATGNLLAAGSPVPAFSSPWLYVLLVVAILSAGASRIGSAARLS